jgi:class 3 adenylate cyclase/tetratricopeptide (TPR) repeat protein
VVCSSCGTHNPPGQKFCGECGAALASGCPSCGRDNPPGQKFCGECGTLLIGTAPVGTATPGGPRPATPAPPAAAPTAERRLVSILFADLVGFTPFAEERDSEDVRETLTRYFDVATDVVTRHGGTIEKFIGDAVMAVWGTPTAREDDAERAVRAALELVDAVRTVGPAISARAGVLTGEAAVTLGATNQGMVAGDLVNTAARLQSVAPPGAVLVGEATRRAAASAIVFEEAGDQLLKGKVAPVAAFRALRVVAERGGRGRSDSLEAPFVGRDDELRLLKDLYHATVREGRTRLVSITGIGGIGKSRLTWEFEKYLDGIVGTIWWHRGRSPSYGEGITFWALSEMIRARAGLLETDDERTTRAGIATMLDGIVSDEAERRWVEPALLALLGIETGIGSDQLFGAWRTFFERLAATGPVVLVFEDLHWADAGTLDFIDHLLEWSRATPLYILTLARPELIDRRPDWGAGRRNFTSMYLEPLAEPAMRSLLAGLVPGLPEAAAQAIIGRAEGIPLYAVETVRMLVAEGRLGATGDGTYAPTGNLATLAVPETLTALITARLDGLDPADRGLVLDAAVLGQSFTTAALAVVSGIDEPTLEPRLRALVRRELFAHLTDPRSPERGQYAFVQALIREVAYNTLARRDRKTRHLAAARHFEALGTDEMAPALAGHYLAASENAADGPEADALAAQARIALRAAAERATALGSHEQALTFLKQAVAVTTDPVDQAALLEAAGIAASIAARHDEAERLLREALERQQAAGNLPGATNAARALGAALLGSFHVDAALAVLEPAVAASAPLGSDPAAVALLVQLGRALYLKDDPVRAIEVTDRALEVAERLDLPDLVAEALGTRGGALSDLGRTYEGLSAIEGAFRLASERGLTTIALRSQNSLGAYLSHRDPRKSLDVLRAGMADARRLGARNILLRLTSNAAEAARATGDWDWALAELDAQLATDLDREDRVWFLTQRIWYEVARGRPYDADYTEVHELVAGMTDPNVLAMVVEIDAVVALGEDRRVDARDAFRRSADLSALNAPTGLYWAGRAAIHLRDAPGVASQLDALRANPAHGAAITARREALGAALAALGGDLDVARAALRAVLGSLDALGVPWESAMLVLDAAALLGGDDELVVEMAPDARATFARLGATVALDRLERALAHTKGAAAG